ncbi:MAG: YdcF family protein [Chloroflexi bacterium]|nr:YdcF family protein [Chloroflexota bacterium]
MSRGLQLLLLAAVLVLAAAGLSVGPGLVVAALATSDEILPSDAIVLTYATGRAGAIRAAELYGAGLAPVVVVSDFSTAETPGVLTDHLSDLYAQELAWRGVPRAALRFLDRTPTSTEEEAVAVRDVIVRDGYRRVILVGQAYRMRRTALSLRHQLPPGVAVLACPVPPREFDLDRWWQTRRGVSAIANEAPRLLYYFLRGRF